MTEPEQPRKIFKPIDGDFLGGDFPTIGDADDLIISTAQARFRASVGDYLRSGRDAIQANKSSRDRDKPFEQLPVGLEVDAQIPLFAGQPNLEENVQIPGVISLVPAIKLGRSNAQEITMVLELDGEVIKHYLQTRKAPLSTIIELNDLGFMAIPDEPTHSKEPIPRILELDRVSAGLVYPKDKTHQAVVTVATSVGRKTGIDADPSDSSSGLTQESIFVSTGKNPTGKEILVVQYGEEPASPNVATIEQNPDTPPPKAYEPIVIYDPHANDPPIPEPATEGSGNREGGVIIEQLDGHRRLGYRPSTTETK